MRTSLCALIAAFLLLAIGTTATAVAAPCSGADDVPTSTSLAKSRSATLCLLNAERRSRGRAPLSSHRELRRGAQGYARDMVRRNFFAHVSPGGARLTERIRRATDYLDGARRYVLGENLAWGTGELSTPRRTVRAWMRSPGHRRNVLDPSFRHVGIGISRGTPVRARASGPAATYATQFGRRG